MDPEDDFQTWMFIFLSSVQAGGDYQYFISSYCDLVDQILTNNKLSGTLENYTSNFLQEVCPTVLRKILNISYVNGDEKEIIINFLQKTSLLVSWAFCDHNNLELFNSLSIVFDGSQTFYTQNWTNYTKNEASQIFDFFDSQSGVDKMKDYILNTDVKIEHYHSYFLLFQSPYECFSTKIKTHAIPLIQKFLDHLEIWEPDNTKVQQICLLTIKLFANSSDCTDSITIKQSVNQENQDPEKQEEISVNIIEYFYTTMLKYGEKLVMHNDKLPVKITGAIILSAICELIQFTPSHCFKMWKKTTKLSEYLSTSDTHTALLSKIEPVFVAIIDPENIMKLWGIAMHAHASQRTTLMSIVAKALATLNVNDAKLFIDEASKDKTDETYDFLIQTFYSSAETKQDFAIYVFSKIIGSDLSFNHQTTVIKTPSRTNSVTFDPEDIKAVQNPPEENTFLDTIAEKINSKINFQLSYNFRSKMVKACLEQLKEKKNPKLISKILSKLATVTYRGDTVFPSTFTDDILKLIEEIPEAKDDLFSVLLILYQKLKDSIDEETLDQFSKVGKSDILWKFIDNKINSTGTTALFDNSCYEKLAQMLDQESQKECSPALMSLIIKFVLIYAYRERYIESRYNYNPVYNTPTTTFPTKAKYTKFPLPYMNLLYNCLLNSSDKEVVNHCIATILKIFCKVHQNKETTEECLNLFNQCNTEQATLNTLTLIYRFAFKINQKIFAEDLGIISHKKPTFTIIDYVSGEKSKKKDDEIDLIIHFKDEERHITISHSAKPELLRTRISNIYNITETSMDLVDSYNQSLIRLPTIITVPNNSVITIKPSYSYGDFHTKPPVESPLLLFDKIHFQDTLFPLLEKYHDNDELIEIIKLLLDLLPNSPSIVQLLDSPKLFLDKFNSFIKSNDVLSQKYMLQILKQRLDSDSEDTIKYINEGLFDLCVSNIKLISQNNKPNKLSKICLQILKDHIEQQFPIDKNIIYQTIIPLIQMFGAPFDNASSSILLLNKFAIYENDTILSLIFDNPETKKLFIENIQKISKEVWPLFKILCKKIPQKIIFDISLEKIDNQCYDYHYIELFAESVPAVSSEINIETLIFKCISVLVKTKSNDLCKAILLLLKNTSSTHSSELITPEESEENEVQLDSFNSKAKELFDVAMQIDNEETQNNFFQLALQLGFNDPSPVYEIVNSTCSDRWNIRTKDYRKSELGLSGLRNLGATCYMNSIIQQMFFIKPFLKQVIETQLTKEGHKEFQYVLTQMEKTSRKYVDTQNFVKNWLAWDKVPVNPKEQQDAFEFLQLILDQMPAECNHYFKGSIKNIVKSVKEEDNFESANDEDFYTIPLEVKNYKDVESSFQVFLQSETFEDYNAESLGRKIDIQKFARIGKAPPILVLQLKRFEYDLQTLNRVKINDRYEFPQEINISNLMYHQSSEQTDEQLSKYDYVLKGVVLHSGTAQGGHYNSLVKINNDWVLFDDQDVSILPPDKFEFETFGGRTTSTVTNSNTSLNTDLSFDDYDSYPSAYLLVYQQENNEEFINFDNNIHYNEEFLKQIEEDNNEFLKNQAIFSDAFFDFCVSILKDNPLPYIFNIFSHSSLSNKIHQLDSLVSHFFSLESIPYLQCSFPPNSVSPQNIEKYVVDGQIPPRTLALIYLLENFETLFQIYTSSCAPEIIDSIQKIVQEVFFISDEKLIPELYKLGELFIQSLPKALQVWRKVPTICHSIYLFCLSLSDSTQESKTADKLVQFIDLVYNPSYQRSSVLTQNINLTDLFKCLKLSEDYDTTFLQKYAQNIIQSADHSKAFISLFKKLSKAKKVDPLILVSILLSMKKDEEKVGGIKMICNAILDLFRNDRRVKKPLTRDSDLSSSQSDYSDNKEEEEEEEEEMDKEERKKEILYIISMFDLCQQRKCVHNLFIEFINCLMKRDQACIQFFTTYPDFLVNYLYTSDYNVNLTAENCFLFLFPTLKKIDSTPSLVQYNYIYSYNDINAINTYFNNKHQYLTLSDSITYDNKNTRKRLMAFYNLFKQRLQEFAQNPQKCYMPESQAPNQTYVDPDTIFYAVSLLRCYNFTIRSLENHTQEDYDLIMTLVNSFKGMKRENDKNLKACIDIAVSFGREFTKDSFVIFASETILSQSSTPQCLDEFATIFEQLQIQDKEIQLQFFESSCIDHLAEKFLDLTQDQHRELFKQTVDLALSLNSDRVQCFLSKLFGPTMIKFFNYIYDPICYTFSRCSHLLDTSIVITFCDTLVKFLITKGKELYTPNVYQYPLTNIDLGLNALIEDKRWMYQVDNQNLDFHSLIKFFPNFKNKDILNPLLKFIILSIPVFSTSIQDLENIIEECMRNLPNANSAQRYTPILIILLNCILLARGDDVDGYIANHLNDYNVSPEFYIFATTKIESNKVWHYKIVEYLIDTTPTPQSQMFFVKSISANDSGFEILHKLSLSDDLHVKWAKYISYASPAVYDYFRDNKDRLRDEFKNEEEFQNFYDENGYGNNSSSDDIDFNSYDGQKAISI